MAGGAGMVIRPDVVYDAYKSLDTKKCQSYILVTKRKLTKPKKSRRFK